MKKPKILVGASITSKKKYLLPEFIHGLRNLTYENKDILLLENGPEKDFVNAFKDLKGVKVWKTPNLSSYRRMIVRDRNILRQFALQKKYDYFLSLEDSFFVPKNLIEELLATKKDVCSGLCFRPRIENLLVENKQFIVKTQTPLVGCFEKGSLKGPVPKHFKLEEVFPSRVFKVDVCSLGCVLISRKVLQKIKFRIDEEIDFDDFYFFALDCKKNKFQIWANSYVECRFITETRESALMRMVNF